MKIGVMTDIHNNLTALEAVIHAFEAQKCDGIICCGDILGIGPYPEETILKIMELPNLIACVQGNHDRYLVEGLPARIPNEEGMSLGETQHHKWEHSLLSDKTKGFLKGLAPSAFLTIGDKKIYVCHYPMDKDNRYRAHISDPDAKMLHVMFQPIEADVYLYGHNHQRSVRMEDRAYINCGSLGCPGKEKSIARAGILEIKKDIRFDSIQVPYDVNTVLKEMDTLNYPEKDLIKVYFYGQG